MKYNKTKLALGAAAASLAMAGALVAPQAAADSHAQQIQMLQQQINQLQAQMNQMQRPDPQVMELNEWMISEKTKIVEDDSKDHMIFFRGGYARMDIQRNDLLTGGGANESLTGSNLTGVGPTSRDGWYIGAGFDFSITNNLWGLWDGTEVLAELMFDYREYGKQQSEGTTVLGGVASNPLCTTVGGAIGGAVSASAIGASSGAGLVSAGNECGTVTVSEFTINASPKIKFMKGSKFRPWIIPVGLQVTVVSPPTDGVTVFQPGMMFGLGADYQIVDNIYVGADARYNLSLGTLDGVDTNGLTAGGYLGLGF